MGVKGVKFQISSFSPPKGTTLARTTYNDVYRVGCVQRCDLWSRWRIKQKKDRN